jgi:two-component system, NarL family, response regulator NreC
MPIRILIADDHAVFRSGLRSLLQREADCTVVGEAATFPEIGDQIDAAPADVLIIDLTMPGPGTAQQAVVAARARHPDLKVVVLTMHEDEYYLREMFRAGASAFVLKKSDVNQVVAAVRAAHHGSPYVDPAMGGSVVAGLLSPRTPKISGSPVPLTPREKEVCRLLALGHTNGEIGTVLSISERTVEVHRSNIMTKLHANNRAELVRFAIDNGLMKLA